MKPTFEEWMLQNGMNNPAALPAEDLVKWRAKYALGFPPEPAEARVVEHNQGGADDMSGPVGHH
jgi:hypothetical protein